MDKTINIEKFEAFLSKAFKLDTEAVAGLYNEAGELSDFTKLEEADAARVKKLTENAKNQHGRGLKEGATKVEAELKEKYEIDSELTGVELFDHILSSKIEEVKTGSTEDITKHPEYARIQIDFDKRLKAKDKEVEDRIKAKEAEAARIALQSKIRQKALEELEVLNPILPEDKTKAQRWKDKYVEEILKQDFNEQEDGIYPLKDGEPLKNEHGYHIGFSDFTKKVATDFFEFRKADDRSSSGNRTEDKGGNFQAPKDRDDYLTRLKDAKTPEERVKLLNYAQEKGLI